MVDFGNLANTPATQGWQIMQQNGVQAGWYATNGGQVDLKSVPVAAGASYVNWGEAANQSGQLGPANLVNSVQLSSISGATAGSLNGDFLDPSSATGGGEPDRRVGLYRAADSASRTGLLPSATTITTPTPTRAPRSCSISRPASGKRSPRRRTTAAAATHHHGQHQRHLVEHGRQRRVCHRHRHQHPRRRQPHAHLSSAATVPPPTPTPPPAPARPAAP